MVKTALAFWLTAAVVLLAACGGGGGKQAASPANTVPAARSTATRAAGGPAASLEPASGRPGTRVTVAGTGWTPRSRIDVSPAAGGIAYASASAADDGSFSVSFVLDKGANGADLQVGRFQLVAASQDSRVTLTFQVEVPRPVGGPGGG